MTAGVIYSITNVVTGEWYNRLRAYAALNRMTNEETLIAALEKLLKEMK